MGHGPWAMGHVPCAMCHVCSFGQASCIVDLTLLTLVVWSSSPSSPASSHGRTSSSSSSSSPSSAVPPWWWWRRGFRKLRRVAPLAPAEARGGIWMKNLSDLEHPLNDVWTLYQNKKIVGWYT